MADLPFEMQARRDFEDQALKLGAGRARLEDQLGSNLEQIVDLLEKAHEVGVPIDHYARMVGVRRQQLYRWRDSIALLRRNADERIDGAALPKALTGRGERPQSARGTKQAAR
jgi:hypothetical protein